MSSTTNPSLLETKTLEEQYILRLPPEHAKTLHKNLKTGSLDKMTMVFPGTQKEPTREGTLYMGPHLMKLTLADLPTVVETHKTPDNKSYYKSGDIGQILIAEDPNQPYPGAKKHTWKDAPAVVDGLTPPATNIRKRKFRSVPNIPKEEVKEGQEEILKQCRHVMLREFEVEKIPISLIDEIYETNGTGHIITLNDGAPPIRTGIPSTFSDADLDLLPQQQKELAKADEAKREKELDDLEGDSFEEKEEAPVKKRQKKQKKTADQIKAEEAVKMEIAEAEQEESANKETIFQLRSVKVTIANEIGKLLSQIEAYKLLLEDDSNPAARRFQPKLNSALEAVKAKKLQMAEVDCELRKYNSL